MNDKRTLGAVTKERQRDIAILDTMAEKVKRGEIIKADAADVDKTLNHYQERNESRMKWGEEMLVESSKARQTLEQSYHQINDLVQFIHGAVVAGTKASQTSSTGQKKKGKGSSGSPKAKAPKEAPDNRARLARKDGLKGSDPKLLAKDGKKRCFMCDKVLPVTDFNRDSARKDGLKYCCRDCDKEVVRQRNAAKKGA